MDDSIEIRLSEVVRMLSVMISLRAPVLLDRQFFSVSFYLFHKTNPLILLRCSPILTKKLKLVYYKLFKEIYGSI